MWQLVEFSKYFTTDEMWPAEVLAANPEYKGKTLYEVLFRNGQVDKFQVPTDKPGYMNDEAEHFGFYLQKACLKSMPCLVADMVMI